MLIGDAQAHWRLIGVHLGLFEPVDSSEWNVRSQEVFRLNDSLQPLESNLMKQIPIFVEHMDFSILGTDEQFLRGR